MLEIICNQFYRLCEESHNRNLDLQSIITDLIELIPKVTRDPTYASDYMPISLVSMTIKFFTKLLANGL
jgi:uncharacterized radical SAM superfamily Fe-S cluster-containing enzyme